MLGYLGAPLWIVVGFIIWLYRDPNRQIPSSPLGIVSPVDGRVDSVQELYDTYLDRESIQAHAVQALNHVQAVLRPCDEPGLVVPREVA